MKRLVFAIVTAAAVVLAPAAAASAAPAPGYSIPQPVRSGSTPIPHPYCHKPAPKAKAIVCKIVKPHPCQSKRPGVLRYGAGVCLIRVGGHTSDLPPIH